MSNGSHKHNPDYKYNYWTHNTTTVRKSKRPGCGISKAYERGGRDAVKIKKEAAPKAVAERLTQEQENRLKKAITEHKEYPYIEKNNELAIDSYLENFLHLSM